ncbi:MAG: histidine kinase [Gemmatimonadota bacterium]
MPATVVSPDRRLLNFLRFLCLATILGLLQTGQFYFAIRQDGGGLPWIKAAGLQMPFWWGWALLGPVIGWTTRHWASERFSWWMRAAIHLGLAICFSTFHSVATMALQHLFNLHPRAAFDFEMFAMNAVYQLSNNLLAYGAVVGLVYSTDFYRRYRERELVASQLSAQLAKAQLHALRMQLNPHFLFNAMNTIAMQVRRAANDDAVRMLAGLSDLLRYMLEDGRPTEVTLRDELTFIERYLAIEQVRFQDRLRVTFAADPDTLEAIVPTLILQPIVENAIRHGISRRSQAGQIMVRASRLGGDLILQVEDDGPGMSPGVTPDPGTGVGLRNTCARLAQLYGSGQSFILTEAAEGGALATIRMPYRSGREDVALVS